MDPRGQIPDWLDYALLAAMLLGGLRIAYALFCAMATTWLGLAA